MELGWERVQVSRFWSAPEEVPSQPAAGTKSKVAGNSLYFFFCPGTFFLAPCNSLYFQSLCSQRAFLPCSLIFESMMLWKICLAFSSALSPHHSPIVLSLQLPYLTLCLTIHRQAIFHLSHNLPEPLKAGDAFKFLRDSHIEPRILF